MGNYDNLGVPFLTALSPEGTGFRLWRYLLVEDVHYM